MTTPRDALAALGYAMDRVDEEDARLGVVGRGRKSERILAALASQGYAVTRSEAGLEVAWAAAEAALPHRGDRRLSWRLLLVSNGKGTYGAEALPPFMPYDEWMNLKVEEYGDTPAAALLALAAALAAEKTT